MLKLSQFASIVSLLSLGLIAPAHAQQVFPAITNQQGFSVNCLNSSNGTCTQYSQLISNATGHTFIPVGYNLNFGYYDQQPDAQGLPVSYKYLTFDLPTTGANAVRLWSGQWAGNPTQAVGNVFPVAGDNSQTAGYAELIKQSLAGGLIPIVAPAETTNSLYDPFDPTGASYAPITTSTGTWSVPSAPSPALNYPSNGTTGLASSISTWIQPTNVALLNVNPDAIVNITNEWGQAFSTVNPYDPVYNNPVEQYWKQSYEYAINAMRQAGINSTLMIDANFATGIIQDGVAIENADPLHNVVFSAHAYSTYNDNADCNNTGLTGCNSSAANAYQYDLQSEIDALAQAGVPVDFGEFAGSNSQTQYNYQNLVTLANQNGLGWQNWLYGTSGVEQSYLNPIMQSLALNPNYQVQPLSAPVPEPAQYLGGILAIGLGWIVKKIKLK
jgi:hypothetical protein